MSEIVGQRMSEYRDADSIQDADKKAYYKEHAKITTFGKLSGTDTNFSNYNIDLSDISGEISGDIASNIADGTTITASNGKLSANVPVTDVTVDGSSVVSGDVAVIPKQVNADWNADGSSSVAKILNKPTLATVATSGSYDDLTDKPTIPVVPTLAPVATSGSYEDLDDKPTIPSIPSLPSGASDNEYVLGFKNGSLTWVKLEARSSSGWTSYNVYYNE